MKATLILLLLIVYMISNGQVKTETITYYDGETKLQGYAAYDQSNQNKLPVVIIVHEWWGLNDYVKKRAEQIAALGYFAFAADMYGEGRKTTKPDEARIFATAFYKDLKMARKRINAAYDYILTNPKVETGKVAAIGYCFGGAIALELARSGADLDGVVAFHSSLHPQGTGNADQIKGKLLVQIGADDKAVSEEQKIAFMDEMNKAKVDWQMNIFSGTVHAFTNPDAGNNPSTGAAYNERADKRSWKAMEDFLKEIFTDRL